MKNSTEARLLVLEPKRSRILSLDTDGKDLRILLEGCGPSPDGIILDVPNRHIYWTNMGFQTPNTEHFEHNDGSIERIDFDGSNRTVIVQQGATFTPKQLTMDYDNGLIYWCDREGMRVMRVEKDGSNITTLVQTGEGTADRSDETKHCVGIAIDVKRGHIFWSQKGPHKAGLGRIFRAGLDLPINADPKNRADIETLWNHLPEPIDLDFNHQNGELYWTDRGAPPNGNSLNRAIVNGNTLSEPEVLYTGLKEAIGLALDIENNRAFFCDLGGHVYSSKLNGDDCKTIFTGDGAYTGMAFMPAGIL